MTMILYGLCPVHTGHVGMEARECVVSHGRVTDPRVLCLHEAVSDRFVAVGAMAEHWEFSERYQEEALYEVWALEALPPPTKLAWRAGVVMLSEEARQMEQAIGQESLYLDDGAFLEPYPDDVVTSFDMHPVDQDSLFPFAAIDDAHELDLWLYGEPGDSEAVPLLADPPVPEEVEDADEDPVFDPDPYACVDVDDEDLSALSMAGVPLFGPRCGVGWMGASA